MIKTSIYLSLIVLLTLLSACSETTAVADKNTNETTKKIVLTEQQMSFNNIVLDHIQERDFYPKIQAYGKVEVPPQNKEIISAKYGGFVRKISILDGMKVRKGQILLEIEDPAIIQMQQDYLENLGSLDYLKSEYERQELLSKQDATSAKNFQQAKSNYQIAKARQLGLKSKLELAGVSVASLSNQKDQPRIQSVVSLRAPFDGIVTKVNIQTGAYVQAQDQLMEIIDTRHAHAEISVYEKDVYKVRSGQEIKMLFPNMEQAVKGSVYLVGHDIAADKTVKIHGHFASEDSGIIPGAFFKAEIYGASQKIMSLPKEAVISHLDKNYVFRLSGKSGKNLFFEAVTVTILAQNNGYIAFEFTEGAISQNDLFVQSGAYEVFSKMMEK